MNRLLGRGVALAVLIAGSAIAGDRGRDDALVPGARNPLLPGYFADPSIVHYRGEWFIFATIDPWGGKTLGLWRSRNFRDWTYETPNWPTKAVTTSADSNTSGVWAPSVVRGRDGRFWMYVSVGSEIWVGVADAPAGPWRDAHGGTPLVPRHYRPGYHMIDAEAFIDDDGQAYLYWGSGLNWVNGHCFMVRLKPDMVSFDGEPQDVTPPHYFEAPFMLKRNGRYFLTFSSGNTTTDTYQVRYAVGPTPFGPFREPDDAPILSTDASRHVFSPGHHAIFRAGARDFILYHRQALPFPRTGGEVLRQVAVDSIAIEGDRIRRIVPTHDGPDVPDTADRRQHARFARLTASAVLDAGHAAAMAGDDNYATGWQAAVAPSSWLQADLGRIGGIGPSMVRPALVMHPLTFATDVSDDGIVWRAVGTARTAGGSPVLVPSAGRGRYVRLRFEGTPGILEWSFAGHH